MDETLVHGLGVLRELAFEHLSHLIVRHHAIGGCGQVRAHAVEVLRRTEDEELRYYALQLVQALRYEASDDSRLAAFLVRRAAANPPLAILLHWCALVLASLSIFKLLAQAVRHMA